MAEQKKPEQQQPQNQNPDYSPSQKKGIFKAIQNLFARSGFSNDEIVSFDPRILEPDRSNRTDPFVQQGLHTIATYNASWRQREDSDEEEEKSGFMARDNRYRDYKQMINEPELEAGLYTYADESTQTDVDGHVVQIVSDNSRIKDMLERLFYQKLDIDREAHDIIFEMCWKGDSFREIYIDKETQREIMRLIYLRPDGVERKESNNKLEKFIVKGEDVEPWRIVHWRNKSIRFGNYGSSIFESGRSVWKQLKLLEDSVIVYRVSRAPERRIFYVDVGSLAPDQADQAIEKFKMRFQKRKRVDINRGTIDTSPNVMSYSESFYIPRVQGRANSELTTLKDGPSPGDIDDLAYFKDKLMALLRIPRDYVGGGPSVSGSQKTYDSGRYLSEQDVKFSRIIGRVQENFLDGLKKIAIVYLGLNGISPQEAEQFRLKMTKASATEELRRIEVQNQQFSLISSIKSLDMFPDVWILSKIMQMDDDEVAEIIHLMKIQRNQSAQAGGAAAGGGIPGGVFPGEGLPGPGGGDIPPEVDQALAGADAGPPAGEASPAPAGEGASQQIAAMLNAMENSAKEYETNAMRTEHDRAKLSALRKRIRNKLARIKESSVNINPIQMLKEVKSFEEEFDIRVQGIDRPRILASVLSEYRKSENKKEFDKIVLHNADPELIEEYNERSITNKSYYEAMIYEDADINYAEKRKTSPQFSMLNAIESYFGILTESKKNECVSNNYLRSLLMEGELKTLPGSNINLVEDFKNSMKEHSKDKYSEALIVRNLLNEQIDEQINYKPQRRRRKIIKKK